MNRKKKPRQTAAAGREAGKGSRRCDVTTASEGRLTAGDRHNEEGRAGGLERRAGLTVIAVALVTCRCLLPAESAADGATLWIVAAWLMTSTLWSWRELRAGEFRLRFDWFDAGIWALVAAHVVAALAVITGDGQKRAALNMLWEWVGLGVLAVMLRQVIVTETQRRALGVGLVSLVVALSGLGLWQSYVWYPETAREVAELQDDYDRLAARRETLSAGEMRQLNDIRRDAVLQGIPLEGRSRVLFGQRLSASTEPLGMFALANSFGGLLASWLALWLGVLLVREGRPTFPTIFAWAAAGLVGWCLLLTKSRTAWVGLVCGLMVLGWLRLRRPDRGAPSETAGSATRSGGRRWYALGGLGMLAGIVVFAAIATGRLDRAVISEGSKSLKYRLEYWAGSVDVMRESPWLGTGPGNFRQHYLRYKRAESSEEIRDPHNFVLDVGVQAGAVGLLGLLAAIWGGYRSFLRTKPSTAAENSVVKLRNPVESLPVFMGIAGGFGAAYTGLLLFEQYPDDRLFVVFAGWLVVAAVLWRSVPVRGLRWVACVAAAVALSVHLMGAGGISMPAVAQLFPVFVLLSGCPPELRRIGGWPAGLGTASSLVLCFACLLTGVVPVLASQADIASAQAALFSPGRRGAESAVRHYEQAAEADPFSPNAWVGLAELALRDWDDSEQRDGAAFDDFVRHMRTAWEHDPRGFHYPRRIGEGYLRKFDVHGSIDDARLAAEFLGEAVSLYPTQSEVRGRHALALAGAGETEAAAAEARRALELDEINRRLGHADRQLSESLVERLQMLGGRAAATGTVDGSGVRIDP